MKVSNFVKIEERGTPSLRSEEMHVDSLRPVRNESRSLYLIILLICAICGGWLVFVQGWDAPTGRGTSDAAPVQQESVSASSVLAGR